MGRVRPTLIGDFLHRIRRPIDLIADKKYKLVTVKMNHNGVVLREEKLASHIKSKMYEVKEGDFILSGIDARNGAFGIVPKELDGAIVTNDFWYFDIDEDVVDKHLFLELTSTQWFDEICRKGSDGTTQRIRLQKNKFFNQEINLPPREEQDVFIERFKKNKKNNDRLKSELTHQQTLLKKLLQQILQEAIEGKLTKGWREENPDVEPASELLKRIKAEKEQLIADNKIKKQKSLPVISEEEKPFELPDGWVWCRLNNLFNFIDYRGKTPTKLPCGIRLITAKNVKMGALSIEPEDFISKEEYKERMTRGFPEKGDLLFTTEAPLGNICMLDLDDKKISTGQRLVTFQRNYCDLENKMFMFFILSPFFQEFLIEKATGMTAKGIKASRLKEMIIPVPPLPEQKAIVKKVESLLTLCDQLQTQITSNQTHAEQLMQAVLKEAFTEPAEDIQENNVVELKPNRVDYYRRMLLAAEIVNQLHKEPTLGHLKLQKLIFLCQRTENMQLPTNFLQQAAGPYDPRMARSLDKQLKDKKWFKYQKNASLKYNPLDDAGSHKKDYKKYFANELAGIQTLIDLFRKAKSDQIEIVATLYACWEKLLKKNMNYSEELLIKEFYAWSEEKEKYVESRVKKAISWMQEKNIVPNR